MNEDTCEKLNPWAIRGVWHSVKDKLPFAKYGESPNVLVSYQGRNQEDKEFALVAILYFDGGNWCYPTGEPFEDIVVSWAELPKPFVPWW